MDKLKDFYNDRHMRDAVEKLFIEVLDEEAITKAKRGDTDIKLKEAYDMIPVFFAKLEELYGDKKPVKKLNQAR